jgi:hypothetical protein
VRIQETPQRIADLDLMKQLARYASGESSWDPQCVVGPAAQDACKALLVNITQLAEKVLCPLLDRISAREMDTFTMHDRTHGIKVAHLMWQVLEPSRRLCLTPPEIALLVLAAYFHDVGMSLTAEERRVRLAPSSDLWEKLDVAESTKERMEKLLADSGSSEISVSRQASIGLNQLQEALLTLDTRERHATRERYEEVLSKLTDFHGRNPENIPDISTCLSFDGNSFRKELIEICVSHNEDAEALVRRDSENPARPRFPRNFPIGACTADLHMVAAALRLADIMDFDRERTPPVLFYYLIPSSLSPHENTSVLESGKHMSISHWHIDDDAIVFRGRCKDHIIHHAIVLFCAAIQEEISATRATFGALKEEISWPFKLPAVVESEIHEEGYHYVPYRFELDDQSIYELLMGGAIYDNPLVAVRELTQNAVDACKLRDALTQLYEPYSPVTTNRILVSYEEPNEHHSLPLLSVSDSGTGMDAFILERYFLRVGQSYYKSPEFRRERVELRKKNLDFAPVSEFGIGFLCCFLLADRVEVETAMWESPRGDTRKRTLIIDGPTRLIRLKEEPNEGSKRFKGTRVNLFLRGGTGIQDERVPQWTEIRKYLEHVCRELPYRVHLQYRSGENLSESYIDPRPLTLEIPAYLEQAVLRIPVHDADFGLEGEIALTNYPKAREAEIQEFRQVPFSVGTDEEIKAERAARYRRSSIGSELRRDGFRIGEVPGLPRQHLDRIMGRGVLRLTWQSRKERRYVSPNLARNATASDQALARQVLGTWLTYLLEHVDELPDGQLSKLDADWWVLKDAKFLDRFSAYDFYRLARTGWLYDFRGTAWETKISDWENGRLDYIWLGEGYDLAHHLLEMVLPKVSTLILGEGGHRFVSRPVDQWEQILKNAGGLVVDFRPWGVFAIYAGKTNDFLYYDYPGYYSFNVRYKDEIESLGEDRLRILLALLDDVVEARNTKQIFKLSQMQADTLTAAADLAGDLLVGTSDRSWPLRSLKP